jgi:hypothetical protein
MGEQPRSHAVFHIVRSSTGSWELAMDAARLLRFHFQNIRVPT